MPTTEDVYVRRLQKRFATQEKLLGDRYFNGMKSTIIDVCNTFGYDTDRCVAVLHNARETLRAAKLCGQCVDYAKHLGVKDLDGLCQKYGKEREKKFEDKDAGLLKACLGKKTTLKEGDLDLDSIKAKKIFALVEMYYPVSKRSHLKNDIPGQLEAFKAKLKANSSILEQHQDKTEKGIWKTLLNTIANYFGKKFPSFFVTGHDVARQMSRIADQPPKPKK